MAANVQDVIMLLGDSITQGGWEPYGFAQRLSYVYARKLDVINRGFSGYNTAWAIPVFEQCFARQHEQQHVPKVRLLTIWFGANDAALQSKSQYLPLPTFVANLTRLVRTVTAPTSAHYSPDTRIVLITPPPVNTLQRGADLQSRSPPQALDRDFAQTRTYAEAVKDVARVEGVPVLDIWSTLWRAAGEQEAALSEFLRDGLHLNEKGYTILFEELMKVIAEKFPELHYDNLQEVFLPFADIDPLNYEESLKKRDAVKAQ